MTDYVPQLIVAAGLEAGYHPAATDDSTVAGNANLLHIINTNGAARTVTLTATRIINGPIDVADVATVIPAGEERFVGPLNPGTFADETGMVDITWSATAGVTWAPLTILGPPPVVTVTSIDPTSGDGLGGDAVTIVGIGFTGATSVTLCGVELDDFIVVNDTTITGTTAGGGFGGGGATGDVVVTVGGVTGTLVDGWTYNIVPE